MSYRRLTVRSAYAFLPCVLLSSASAEGFDPSLSVFDHTESIPIALRAPESFDQVLSRVAAESADPQRVRGTLLARLRSSNGCLRPDLTADQLAELFRTWRDQPQSVTSVDEFGRPQRFAIASQTFVGNGTIGTSQTSTPASITYSFPPDVLLWGEGPVANKGPNNLHATHIARWGALNTDTGREYIRQGLAVWRKWCNIGYSEVTDDGRPFDQVPGRRAGVGDTRIGGANVANPNFIAYNNFPASGSDMFLDTFQFTATNFFTSTTSNFRNLRNTISHEHGHGLGKIHQIPCNNTKCMEPAIATGFDGIAIDDIRAGHRNFGDRFSGNHSPATATDLGDITAGPVGRSLRLRNLSTTGALSPSNPAGADWFRINSTVSGRNLVIRVIPTGGSYQTGSQMAIPGDICAGTASTVNANQAGDLRIDFYVDPEGDSTFSSSEGGPGTSETTGLVLGTGTRYIRVSDTGPNPAADQVVQLYDLEIEISNGGEAVPSDPYCIAGINKIAYVGENCVFFPAINSEVTEPGATITAFQYDLNGDGTFETSGSTGGITYTTPGVRNVTIRSIDSNDKFDDDTITVTVLTHDNCDGARQIFVNQPLAGNTLGATSAGDAPHGCVPLNSDSGLWYRFVPAATALHSIFTCPASIDTVVSIHSGTCGSLTRVACDDDDAVVCPPSIRASSIPNLMLTGGQPYYIKVSGFLSEVGSFTLNVTQSAPIGVCCNETGFCSITDQASCPSRGVWTTSGSCEPNNCIPANDLCTSPAQLALNTPRTGTTVNIPATDPDIGGCGFGYGRGVWFSFTPAVSNRYVISACGSNYNNLLVVYPDASCANQSSITCNNDSAPTNPCAGNSFAARIPSVPLTAGTPHRILLAGIWFGDTNWDAGNYQIVVRCFADFDENGTIAVADLFSYLNTWFAGTMTADTDASGAINVTDIFDYLNAWFLGC